MNAWPMVARSIQLQTLQYTAFICDGCGAPSMRYGHCGLCLIRMELRGERPPQYLLVVE